MRNLNVHEEYLFLTFPQVKGGFRHLLKILKLHTNFKIKPKHATIQTNYLKNVFPQCGFFASIS